MHEVKYCWIQFTLFFFFTIMDTRSEIFARTRLPQTRLPRFVACKLDELSPLD